MKLFILLLFISVNSAWAQDLNVEWACPKNSSDKTPITVSFNDQGKLLFKPDIFTGKYKSGNLDELSQCIGDFQKNVSEALKAYQALNCAGSKGSLCVISQGYIDQKVFDKLKSSHLVKKTPGIKISMPGESASSSSDSSNSGSSNSQVRAETPEAFLQQKIASKEIDPKNLNQSFSFKDKTYKVSDFDQVVGSNIENVFENLNREEAKQFAQNYMVAKADVLKNSAPSEKRTQVLNNLNQMFGYIYGEKGAEELAKILECKPEDDLKPITDILTNLEETKKVDKCKLLEPGEHKVFKKDSSNYYGTGHYLLKRTKEGDYQAVLNVRFKNGAGTVSTQEMMERSKNCLDIASPHIKGPNGERLQLTVLTPEEAQKLPDDERPQPYDVSIEPVGYGTNAASYAQDVKCPTIAHEMLHLLGLCDEYLEDRPQYGNMWNCRVVTKAPSIMRDLSAFDQAVGKAVTCNCSSQTCKSIMNGSNEDFKKIYTGQSSYDVTDYKFRNQYCRDEYINTTAKTQLTDPSKAVIVLSDLQNELVMESRIITPSSSAPYYRMVRSKTICRCPAGDTNCIDEKNRAAKAVAESGTRDFCPQGAPYVAQGSPKTKSGVSMEGETMSMVSKPKIPSLLQPQQFNKILAGACSGKGADAYNECADFAYKSDSKGPCNVPEKCRDDKYFLGSQQ